MFSWMHFCKFWTRLLDISKNTAWTLSHADIERHTPSHAHLAESGCGPRPEKVALLAGIYCNVTPSNGTRRGAGFQTAPRLEKSLAFQVGITRTFGADRA